MNKKVNTNLPPRPGLLAVATGLLFYAAIVLPPAAGAKDSAPERVWPLSIQTGISSNFCEYREGHFHAGIDIRAYGSTGLPCLAVYDGYVNRIKISTRCLCKD